MSVLNPLLTSTEVAPMIESRLFDDHAESRFAIGILAVNDQVVPGLESEYRGYYDLRRNVYVDQTGQLDASEINEDGTDRDIDDYRSVAFGAVENLGSGKARVIGAMREIIVGAGTDEGVNRDLPVKEFCPEAFSGSLEAGSVEISRMISRHEDKKVQQMIQDQLHILGSAYIANHNLGKVYAVIEPWLESHFQKINVPVSRIGDPVYIEHYKDYNLPIEIRMDELKEELETKFPGALDYMRAMEDKISYIGRFAMSGSPDQPKKSPRRRRAA